MKKREEEEEGEQGRREGLVEIQGKEHTVEPGEEGTKVKGPSLQCWLLWAM